MANTFFRRSKVIISFRSPENSSDQEIESLINTFDLLKNGKKPFDLMIVKIFDLLFRSPEIRSPDTQSRMRVNIDINEHSGPNPLLETK